MCVLFLEVFSKALLCLTDELCAPTFAPVPKPNPLLSLCSRKRRQPNRDSIDSKPGTSAISTTKQGQQPSGGVKLTVVTSAGTCKVTSSTTTVVMAHRQTSANKSKAKKQKRLSKKLQKKYNKDWDNESDKESEGESEAEESKPKKQRLSLDEKLEDLSCQNAAPVNNCEKNIVTVTATTNGNHPTLTTGTPLHNNSSIDLTNIETHEDVARVKSSKKKKKKHSRSDEHHHKKRKHKHKKNRNKYENSTDVIAHTDQTVNIASNDSNNTADGGQQQLFPHVEKVDGNLRMRIKSPPPNKLALIDGSKSPAVATTPVAGGESLTLACCEVSGQVSSQDLPVESCCSTPLTSNATVDITAATPKVPRHKREQVPSSLRIKDRSRVKSQHDSSRPKRSSSRAESMTYDEQTDDDDNEQSSGDDDLSDVPESGEDIKADVKKVKN